MNFCRHCGAKITSTDDMFCVNCGAPLQAPNPEEGGVQAGQAGVAAPVPGPTVTAGAQSINALGAELVLTGEAMPGAGFEPRVHAMPSEMPGQPMPTAMPAPALPGDVLPPQNAPVQPLPTEGAGMLSAPEMPVMHAPAPPMAGKPVQSMPQKTAPAPRQTMPQAGATSLFEEPAAQQRIAPRPSAAGQQRYPGGEPLQQAPVQPETAAPEWRDLQELISENPAGVQQGAPPAPPQQQYFQGQPARVAPEPAAFAGVPQAAVQQAAPQMAASRQAPVQQAAVQQAPVQQAAPVRQAVQAAAADKGVSKVQKIQMAAEAAEAAAPRVQPVAKPVESLFDGDAAPVRPSQNRAQSGYGGQTGEYSARQSLPKPRLPEQPQRRRPSRYEDLPSPQEERAARGGSRLVTVILLAVLAIVVTFAVVLVMLYFRNRPATVIANFTQAISEQDVKKLKDTVTLKDARATEEGWLALCAAFPEAADIVALKAELNGDKDAVSGLQYPSITLVSEDLLLFVKKHHIEIAGVEVLAPGAPEGAVLALDEVNYPGTLTADGVLFSNILPGRYQYQLLTTAGATPAVPGVLDILSTTPTRLDGGDGSAPAAATASVTLENCLADDAMLFIDNIPSEVKPVSGVATLPEVAVGSVISIVATQDGKSMEAKVTFSDAGVTALRFDGYVEVNAPASAASSSVPQSSSAAATGITEAEVGAVITGFYTSYLECINTQKLDALTLSTNTNKANVEKRIATEANKENLFTFVGASYDAASLKESKVGEYPSVTFNATFTYTYVPRTDSAAKATAGSNNQTVQMLYIDGKWLVSSFSFVSDGDFNNHVIAG